MSGAKKMVPKRRFKKFLNAGDWEQRKLGEIADITKLAGFEFTKYIVYSDKGNIIALRGLNIKDGDLNLEDVKYIDSSDFTKLKRSKLFRNDILFTYVGTIGEVARIQEADKYYLAPNVSRIRIKNRLLSEFLMYYMDRDLFYQKIIFPLIATSSQPALSMANIREFNITYPSDTNEQQKIALVFNRISHLITLHQRKLDKLQATKKALLQEMFPEEGQDKPKRRFKGFTDAWEQRKLSEVVTINPKTELPDEFKYVDLESVVGTNLLGFQVIKKENAPSRAQRLASYGDVFYQTVRPYQRNNYLFENIDKDMVFSTGYAQLRSNLDSYFLLTLVQNDNFVKVVLDNCTGTSYPAINGSELGKITVQIPSNDAEANQIGKVFREIDNIITLHQRKLDKLKNLKQAYLNEMFV